MNLQDEISRELWDVIAPQYTFGHYRQAVIHASNYLRDLIREAAKSDADDRHLIADVFQGGKEGVAIPLLRLNTLATITDRNEQNALAFILQGLYIKMQNLQFSGCEQVYKADARKIIMFIDYLLSILKTVEGFKIENWLNHISDEFFVKSKKYVVMKAQEVPPAMYSNVLVGMLDMAIQKMCADTVFENINMLFREILKKTNEKHLVGVMLKISEILSESKNNIVITRIIALLPDDIWKMMMPASKMRMENIIIQSVRKGTLQVKINEDLDLESKVNDEGILGTWGNRLIFDTDMQIVLYNVILDKIKNGEEEELNYVMMHYWKMITDYFFIVDNYIEKSRWINAICRVILHNQSSWFANRFTTMLQNFPPAWQKTVLEKLDSLRELNSIYYSQLTPWSYDEDQDVLGFS